MSARMILSMTLRLIGIVALSLVVAQPAYAEHCKGQHKNDPGCEAPGGTDFILMDSDPAGSKQVGTIVSMDGDPSTIVTLVEIQGRNVLLKVNPNEITLTGTVQFDEPDCDGNAFINPDEQNSGFRSSTIAFTKVILADQNAPGGSRRELWELEDVAPIDLTAFSQLAGTCNNFVGGLLRENVVPAAFLENDLHSIFPPPYFLELEKPMLGPSALADIDH